MFGFVAFFSECDEFFGGELFRCVSGGVDAVAEESSGADVLEVDHVGTVGGVVRRVMVFGPFIDVQQTLWREVPQCSRDVSLGWRWDCLVDGHLIGCCRATAARRLAFHCCGR